MGIDQINPPWGYMIHAVLYCFRGTGEEEGLAGRAGGHLVMMHEETACPGYIPKTSSHECRLGGSRDEGWYCAPTGPWISHESNDKWRGSQIPLSVPLHRSAVKREHCHENWVNLCVCVTQTSFKGRVAAYFHLENETRETESVEREMVLHQMIL